MLHGNRSRAWIFFKNNIVSIAFFTAIIVGSIYYTAIRIYEEVTMLFKAETQYAMSEMDKENHGIDYKTICTMTNCIALSKKDTGEIVFVKPKLETTKPDFLDKKSQVLTVIKSNGQLEDYVIKLNPYLTFNDMNIYSETTIKIKKLKSKHLFNIIVYSTIWFFCGMMVIVLVRMYIRKYQGIRDREVMEERLRKQLTESVHHELSGPLSTIKANLKAGFASMYPCPMSPGSCQIPLGIIKPYCEGCELEEKFTKVEEGTVHWNYINALTAIDQMQSILNIMANAKHIQYTNGSVSLSKIMDNLSSSKRLTTYNLVKIEVENKEGLKHYSCGGGLNNGELVNILSTMINNSIEAEANKITISWAKKNDKYLYLFLKDNGYGVRDNRNRLIKDVSNFKIKYGYSTKISPYDLGDVLNKRKIFNLITNIIGTDIDYVKVRGSGLHLNKEILEMFGGTIELYDNSESGATFRVTLPIKEVHFDELESKVIKNV